MKKHTRDRENFQLRLVATGTFTLFSTRFHNLVAKRSQISGSGCCAPVPPLARVSLERKGAKMFLL